jgi:ATP-dependent helicase/nuclease subunit A
MKKTKWTKPQNLAIETVGRGVLVTASAGAGKTAVLSERCIRRICDARNQVDVDKLLVLTFTEAAAEEMKGRIAEKLYAICMEDPGNRHLRKQLVRLDAAWIGTIHGFCKRVLMEHFYLAGLDPRFGILDPDQQKLIRARAMTTAIEAAWRDETVSASMRELFHGRQLRGGTTFPDCMLKLTAFLDSVPDRNAFYQSAARLAGDSLIELHLDYLRRQLTLCRDMAMYARHLDQTIAGGCYLTEHIETFLPTIKRCLDAVQRSAFTAVSEIIGTWQFDSATRYSKKMGLEKADAERIKSFVDNVKKKITRLKELVVFQPELLQWIIPAADRQTQTVIAVLQRFDAEYRAVKRGLNVLDFADLEHQTLAMFDAYPAVAEKLRQRFAYVFVDEYQDINDTQQRLLQAVSRPDNVFAVGDVKQSIYAFRQSRPEIFLEQLSAATEDEKSSGIALRVDMNDNFRSRREILGFVNRVFGRMMTQSLAGLDYKDRAELIAGLEYPPLLGTTPASRKAVEFYLLDEQSSDENSEDNGDSEGDSAGQEPAAQNFVTAVQRQAAFIARRIRQMVENAEFEILDKKTQQMRPVEYRDIVVLMRAMSRRAAEYVELMRLAGIPVSSQSQCGYFAATEVMDFLSLLKVLDNPLQDIELAAVLRSALFCFTDSDLAMMRWFARQGNEKFSAFFEVVTHYADSGPNDALKPKAAEALSVIQAWRIEARRKPLSELIWQIFEDRGLLAFASALPNGPQRRANLLMLHDRAIQFESFAGVSVGRNLAAFVDFLEKLLEEEFDWAPAQPDSGSENAVRVMSVHKSKGLEFPVVFLAELNRNLYKTQSGSACEINAQMLALELPDLPHGIKVPTPALQIIRQNEKQSAIAEEMRILYVAMTRAKDRLVLTASEKCDRCQEWLARRPDTPTLPDWLLTDAQSHLDWILAALAPSGAVSQAIASDGRQIFEDDLFIVSRVGKNELDALTGEIRNQKRQREKTYIPVPAGCSDLTAKNVFEQIRGSFEWRYPCDAVKTLHAKFSVSTLTHRDDEFSQYADFSIPAPDSFSVQRSDPLSVGSAVHLVFQHLPLQSPLNEEVIRRTIASLSGQKRFSSATAEQIDIAAIASFFQTAIGSGVLVHPENVLREWPFTLALPVSELGIDCPGESVVVQGVVDLIIRTAQGVILVDFKTDKISSQKVAQQVKHYQTQLGLYRRAAEAILRVPVVGAYFYFLHPQVLFSVDPGTISLKTPPLSDALPSIQTGS